MAIEFSWDRLLKEAEAKFLSIEQAVAAFRAGDDLEHAILYIARRGTLGEVQQELKEFAIDPGQNWNLSGISPSDREGLQTLAVCALLSLGAEFEVFQDIQKKAMDEWSAHLDFPWLDSVLTAVMTYLGSERDRKELLAYILYLDDSQEVYWEGWGALRYFRRLRYRAMDD